MESHISVSANRLSPSPDVISTIWELGSVEGQRGVQTTMHSSAGDHK